MSAPSGTDQLDASGFIVMPGLVNAHTHAHNNLLRGLADRWTLEDLLNHGPALNSNRTTDDHYLAAAVGAVEMLKTGCTAAYDLFTAVPAPTPDDAEAVARAYVDVGMRAVIAPPVADLSFLETVPGLMERLPSTLRQAAALQPAPTDGLLRLCEETIRRCHGRGGGRIRVALAPTIPTQCTEALLTGCARLAHEHGVGIHTTSSESLSRNDLFEGSVRGSGAMREAG